MTHLQLHKTPNLVSSEPGAAHWIAFFALVSGDSLAQTKPLVGAIRWDNWSSDSRHTKVLAGTSRLPFFKTEGPDGNLLLLGGEKNVVDAENAYGYAAGLDYWIFGYYSDTGSFGRSVEEARSLQKAVNTFVSLADRRGMKFAIEINQAEALKYKENLLKAVEGYIQDRDYLRLEDGTVPLFVYTLNEWKSVLGTAERVNEYFSTFAAAIKMNTGIQVKLITVGGNVTLMKPYLKPNGPFSVSTVYAHGTECCGVKLPYKACVAANETFWNSEKVTGFPFIPNITIGWDWRPIVNFPDQMYGRKIQNPSWCEQGTATEWKKLVRDAVGVGSESARQAAFSGVIVYAWNELSEGGWLVPTVTEGTYRIEAMAEALARERPARDIVLRFPVNADGYLWPCPPGLYGDPQEVQPNPEEESIRSGRWLERSCKLH